MGTAKLIIKNPKLTTCSVNVYNGIFQELPDIITKTHKSESYAIITDDKVNKLYVKDLMGKLKKKSRKVFVYIIKNGEKSKNMETATKVLEQMTKDGHTRNCLVVTIGGGVVGDLGGFVASVYMRGVEYIQVPTSMLSMVDSSIGGKTGVNTSAGKNLIGTFWHPAAIYTDPNTLKTLPEKNYKEGLTELIKHFLLAAPKMLNWSSKNIDRIKDRDPDILEELIYKSVEIKCYIVSQDERESDKRRYLNLGHTIGHAIEKASEFKVSHGRAVAFGILAISSILVDRKKMSKKVNAKINNLFENLDLKKNLASPLKFSDITKAIKSDKKRYRGKSVYVGIRKPGKPIILNDVSNQELKRALKTWNIVK